MKSYFKTMKGQHFLLAATGISIILPSADVMVSASAFSSWWENHGVLSLRGSGNNANTGKTDTNSEQKVLPTEPEQATLPPATPPPCTTPADFCIADVRECPDGSYVARDPKLCCAFPPCPDKAANDNTTSTPLLDWLDQVLFGPGRLATLVGNPDKDTPQAP